MMNIILHYQYSKSETEQLEGTQIFSNHSNFTLEHAHAEIEKYLIGHVFFIPNQLGIAALDGTTNPSEDADYHEYEGLEFTADHDEGMQDISELIAALKQFKNSHPDEFW